VARLRNPQQDVVRSVENFPTRRVG
jgi:hypothetical protein